MYWKLIKVYKGTKHFESNTESNLIFLTAFS